MCRIIGFFLLLILTGGVLSQSMEAQVMISGPSGIKGELILSQNSPYELVKIVGQITGLKPGRHGFIIYEKNNINCDLTGGHFNPFNVTYINMIV